MANPSKLRGWAETADHCTLHFVRLTDLLLNVHTTGRELINIDTSNALGHLDSLYNPQFRADRLNLY
jgi:hypothetical protein